MNRWITTITMAMKNDMASNNAQIQLEKPKVLVLTGPTAVGKTKVSIELAKHLDGEIISADSVQVYKGLDIGSDKISEEERQGIPHHMIDILSVRDEFSAGDFYTRARAVTEEILSRGKVPIVVGGTGFYLRWYTMGKPSTPVSTKESEANAVAALEKNWSEAAGTAGQELDEREKWEAGLALVERLGDVESAQRLRTEFGNMYRLVRVVDILLQSPGKTLAELDMDTNMPQKYDFRCFFLTRPRIELYRRIDERVEEMFLSGLISETFQELMAMGMKANEHCSTRGIGYRQVLEFLEKIERKFEEKNSVDECVSERDIYEVVQKSQSASRKLCHRQMTWFRDEPNFRWIKGKDNTEEVMEEIISIWEKDRHHADCGDNGILTKEEQQQLKRYQPQNKYLTRGSKHISDLQTETMNIFKEYANKQNKKQKVDS